MPGGALDDLISAWSAVDWPAATARLNDPDRPLEQPIGTPDLDHARNLENDFLAKYPAAAEKWQALKEKRFGPAAAAYYGSHQRQPDAPPGAGERAAGAYATVTKAALAPAKAATFGLLDPLKVIPGGEDVERAARPFEQQHPVIAGGLEGAGSLLGMVAGPVPLAGKALGALGRGAARAAPALGALGRTGVGRFLGSEVAPWMAAGYAEKPGPGQTRMGGALEGAKAATAFGLGGKLAGMAGDALIGGRAVSPLAERAVQAGSQAVAMGGVGAALAPPGQRAEAGKTAALTGLLIGGIHDTIGSSDGQKAARDGIKERYAAVRRAAADARAAKGSGDRSAAYQADKALHEARDALVSFRQEAPLVAARIDNPDLARQVEMAQRAGRMGAATAALAKDRADLSALDRREAELAPVLRGSDEQARAAAAADVAEITGQRALIERRRPALQAQELEHAFVGRPATVAGKKGPVNVVVKRFDTVSKDGRDVAVAHVVLADGTEARVPLTALKPVEEAPPQEQQGVPAQEPQESPMGPPAARQETSVAPAPPDTKKFQEVPSLGPPISPEIGTGPPVSEREAHESAIREVQGVIAGEPAGSELRTMGEAEIAERRAALPEQPAPEIAGRRAQVDIAGREKGLPVQYAVVEADTLLPSHDIRAAGTVRARPEYPEGLQPRDYTAPAERDKVAEIAATLPEKVGLHITDTTSAGDGPPIITRAGRVVLSGNGRTMGRQVAAERGLDAEYRAKLIADAASYGLDPAAIEGMKHPTLVRVADIDPASAEAKETARLTNVPMTMAQGRLGNAASYAGLLDDATVAGLEFDGDQTLGEMLSSAGGRPVIDALREAVPAAVRPRYFNDAGGLTEEGRLFARDVLAAKALPAEDIAVLAPAQQEQVVRALPQLMHLRTADLPAAANPLPQIREALAYYARDLGHGLTSLERMEEQSTLGFAPKTKLSPGGRAMVQWLEANARRPAALRDALRGYLEAARGADQGALFGGMARAPAELATEAFGVPFPENPFHPTPPRSQRGSVFLGGNKNERKARVAAHAGDERKADERYGYERMAAQRPELARRFRAEVLDETLDQLATHGVPAHHLDILRRLEAGQSPEQIQADAYPALSVLQVHEIARMAHGEALLVADRLYGKNGLLVDAQDGAWRKTMREFWNGTLFAAGDAPPLLPTEARLRALGKKGDINFEAWYSPRRLFGGPMENTTAELFDAIFGWEAKGRAEVAGIVGKQRSAERALTRLAKLTPSSDTIALRAGKAQKALGGIIESGAPAPIKAAAEAVRGLLDQHLSEPEIAAFDALDGLRRQNNGQESTRAQVEEFKAARAAEYEAFSPGAGKDWLKAVASYEEMWAHVRNRYRQVYGRDISASIGEGLYATHMFQDSSGRLTPWAKLPGYFRDPIKSKVWSRFEQARSGATGYVPDIQTVARLYFPGMLRKLNLDEGLRKDGEIVRRVYGDDVSVGSDLRGALGRAIEGGKLADGPDGRRLQRRFARVATTATEDNRWMTLRVPAATIESVKDVEGNPIVPRGTKASGGSFAFVRGRAPKAGDPFFTVHEARDGAPEVRVPWTELEKFHWRTGGIQELATSYGQPGRYQAAQRWMKRMKQADEPGSRLLDNAITNGLRMWVYHSTLGLDQIKPVVNNLAGGMFMLSAHSGVDRTAKAAAEATSALMGKSPATMNLLDEMGVLEQPEMYLDARGPLGAGKARRALQGAEQASFAGFTAAERFLRSAAALAGHRQFEQYAKGEMERFVSANGITMDDRLTWRGGRAYRGGEAVPGSERIGALLDGSRDNQLRDLSRRELEAEIGKTALLYGRATVAKTQFLYSAAFTPEALSTPLGRILFQLNQYPIRAAMQFYDAVKTEKDYRRVGRWLATGLALSVAAHVADRDLTGMMGVRVGDLLNDASWDEDKETLSGQAKSVAADLHLPFPVPFSQGPPFIPMASVAMVAKNLAMAALNLDPGNPMPVGDHWTADKWAQLEQAWRNTPRSAQSAVAPARWRQVQEFATAERDSEGRAQVKTRDDSGYTPETTGEFLESQLSPATPKSLSGSYRRSEQSDAREEAASGVATQYRRNLVELALGKGPSEFLQRQNETLLKANPALAQTSDSDVRKAVEEAGLPKEVGDMAGRSLPERARRYLDWIETDATGQEKRAASMLLWGGSIKQIKPRIESLREIDPPTAKKLLAAWRKALR